MPGSSACIDANYDSDASETFLPMSPNPPLTAVKRSPSTPFRQASRSAQPHPGSVIDLTNSDDDDDDGGDTDGILHYPNIPAMLVELHEEYSALNFRQYGEVLLENGFAYVNQLVEEEVRQQLVDLGIPVGVINLLLSRAQRLIRRTEKLKQED